jgi:hypothetical protein
MLILLLHLFFWCVIILNKHVKCFVTRRVIYIMQSVHVCMCVYVCVCLCCEYPSMSSAEVLYPVNQYQYYVIKFLHTLLLDPLCVSSSLHCLMYLGACMCKRTCCISQQDSTGMYSLMQ